MSDADLFTDEPAPSSADLFTDDPAPKSVGGFAENALDNLGRMVNPVNIVKGLASSVKQGLYDIPKAAIESSLDATKGIAHAVATGDVPDADDVTDAVSNSPIIQKTREMTEPIAKDPVGYAYKNPLDVAALLGGPALALRGGVAAAGDAAEAADAAQIPKAAEPEVPSTPAPGKDLPVIDPGAKTGDPHALFAHNDNFGPEGAPRSIYNVFGDPEHPAIKNVGHGSSVTQDVLEKNGIPITGQQPGAVAKFGKPLVPPVSEPTETMYHGTTAKAVDSINKNGFGASGPIKDSVFLTKDKNTAMKYANYAASHYEKGGKPVVLEMQVPRSKLAVSHDLEMGQPLTTEQANMVTGHPERTLDDYLNGAPGIHDRMGGGNKGYFVLDNKTANEALKNGRLATPISDATASGVVDEGPSSAPRISGNTVTKPDPVAARGFIPKILADEEGATPGAAAASAPPPKPPPSALSGISDEIKNYVNSKYQAAQARPGMLPKIGNYLTEESNKLRNKDLGLQPGMMKTMGTGYKGLEKADQLMDYASDKGYFKPGLSDGERRTQIQNTMNSSGAIIGKMRQLADSRGAPDIAGIRSQLETQLKSQYGSGVNKAPNEVNNVLDEFDKAPKTFQGMSDLATHLNKSATPIGKLGQHPGPTTDAADIVARAANDQARKLLSPQENDLYTQNLRDFGASKKLEQVTAASARRERGARSNQRGVMGRAFQEALDRGGYRMGGNIANRLGKGIQSGRVKTLPQFFEDLGHQSNEEIDDTIGNMAKGGIVPGDVRDYVMRK